MTDFDTALRGFSAISVDGIGVAEHRERLDGLVASMRLAEVDAVWLDASSSLTYYTGLSLRPSERIHGALALRDGSLVYVTPNFERPKLESMLRLPGNIVVWEEHEDPFALFGSQVKGRLALDPETPFRFASRIADRSGLSITEAEQMIVQQRRIKSAAELAIIQTAMDASYLVQKAVHAGLRPGIKASEVANFISAAHIELGMSPVFAAVQFAEATAYPHGVAYDQELASGDMVLVDMGARLHGYHSDITRTYVFGPSSARQRQLWDFERQAQLAAFTAAKPGTTCELVDKAARSALERRGFGPGYAVPGLPHRTGHGLGLDIHEGPWIVQGDTTPLAPGMCFSIEPMLCVYGEFGVRLEDIVYMTETGPRWFCPPAERSDGP